MVSKWEVLKQNLLDPDAVKPWDVLNPNVAWAPEDISKSRFDICKSCPELISLTSQCKQCGCIMKIKTKLQEATCPLGKW